MELHTLMDFTAGLFKSFNLPSISLSKGEYVLASTFNSSMVHKLKNTQSNNIATLYFPIPPCWFFLFFSPSIGLLTFNINSTNIYTKCFRGKRTILMGVINIIYFLWILTKCVIMSLYIVPKKVYLLWNGFEITLDFLFLSKSCTPSSQIIY